MGKNLVGERERVRQIGVVMARHGLTNLIHTLGLRTISSGRQSKGGPQNLVYALRELGPVAVKFGQVLAMRTDVLKPEWTVALASLQDSAPPLPFSELQDIVEEAVGGPIESQFAAFNPEALAAGSIAQVHAATMRDGREVIVKIRRPGIEHTIDADLRLLRRLARLAEKSSPDAARLRPNDLLRHFADGLERELDLSAEGRASDSIGTFLEGLGVQTARFDWTTTGRCVNVQERVSGFAATSLNLEQNAGFDLTALARAYAQAVVRMIILHGEFHADPHPGNVIVRENGELVFIDFGSVGALLPGRRDELVRLALSIGADDYAAVVTILLDWAGDPAVDRDRLAKELKLLIDRFNGMVLARIDLSEIFGEIFALLRSFKLALPPDLALLLRTLLIAEGFVRRFDPDFDIGRELKPIVRDLLMERASGARLLKETRRLLAVLGSAASESPDIVSRLVAIGKDGKLPFSMAPRDIAALREMIRAPRAPDPHLVPGALVIAAALLFQSEIVLSAMCAAAALVMIIWSKIRLNK